MADPTIIGLTGAAGAGKSTAANILVTQYGFKQIAFADPLKDMLRVLFRYSGMDADDIERHINGDLKEAPCEALGGSTSRYAQQSLGTEWGRDRVNALLWVTLAEARIQSLLDGGVTRIVVDDVRMANEAEAIINYQMVADTAIYRVAPVGTLRRHPPTHRSEDGLPNYLVVADLMHSYTMESLAAEVEAKVIQPLQLTREGRWHNA